MALMAAVQRRRRVAAPCRCCHRPRWCRRVAAATCTVTCGGTRRRRAWPPLLVLARRRQSRALGRCCAVASMLLPRRCTVWQARRWRWRRRRRTRRREAPCWMACWRRRTRHAALRHRPRWRVPCWPTCSSCWRRAPRRRWRPPPCSRGWMTSWHAPLRLTPRHSWRTWRPRPPPTAPSPACACCSCCVRCWRLRCASAPARLPPWLPCCPPCWLPRTRPPPATRWRRRPPALLWLQPPPCRLPSRARWRGRYCMTQRAWAAACRPATLVPASPPRWRTCLPPLMAPALPSRWLLRWAMPAWRTASLPARWRRASFTAPRLPRLPRWPPLPAWRPGVPRRHRPRPRHALPLARCAWWPAWRSACWHSLTAPLLPPPCWLPCGPPPWLLALRRWSRRAPAAVAMTAQVWRGLLRRWPSRC